jgi:hypothetical protein
MSYPTYNSSVKNERGDNGASNAAILTFNKDVIDSLIKELTQNSIDAKIDKNQVLRLRVRVLDIEKSEIPNFEQFEKILESIVDYWKDKDKSSHNVFLNSLKYVQNNSHIKTFVFEDYGTKGLTGDFEKGSFKSLVFDEGTSSDKGKGSLGGHGIGKNAVFGFSILRSLVYSSINQNQEYKFMGISKLGEYQDENNKKRSHRVYYGNWKNIIPDKADDLTHVDDENSIPDIFKREGAGLSCFALGIKINEEVDWEKSVKEAFLKNYWFLLHNNLLEVTIGNEILNSSNYYSLANQLFSDAKKENNIMPYINTYLNPDVKEVINIETIGNVEFYFKEEVDPEDNFPNNVVYLRDGMMIKYENPEVASLPKKIAGVIFCNNDLGNEILGRMEPPAHNDFEPSLLPEKMPEYSKRDGERILKELRHAKKNIIKDIKSKYNIATTNLETVDNLISGEIKNNENEYNNGDNNNESKESFVKRTTFYTSPIQLKSKGKVLTVEDPGVQDELNIDEVVTQGGGGVKNNTTNGGKAGLDGKGENEEGNSEIIKNIISKIPKKKSSVIELSFRLFYYTRTTVGNEYKLIIKSRKSYDNIKINITQHGDSGSSGEMTSILTKFMKDDQDLDFTNHKGYSVLEDVSILANVSNIFTLVFDEKNESAFKINYK